MPKPTDIRPVAVRLFFLPIETRVPLKFGAEVTTEVTCARVCMTVEDREGRRAVGWGETPLSVHWVWPSLLPYEVRHIALKELCLDLAALWCLDVGTLGHPIEVGQAVNAIDLPARLERFNATRRVNLEPIPWLAALVCNSAFDLALHDAYGILHGVPTYSTYNPAFMNFDLAHYLVPEEGSGVSFDGLFPDHYLTARSERLEAWHLVGGKDPIDRSELTGEEPTDGYPVLLRDWIRRDGLNALKVKLRGDDRDWDRDRLLRVGRIAIEEGLTWLTADFNCAVSDPSYVVSMLDELMLDDPRLFGMLLYVEQPFPYDIDANRIDVRPVSARKPLFMDESAHNWELVRLGRSLGWSGVALKTCKTQTGALLSLCWAKAHGMPLMVQDLTNPMLAQIPHALLAAHAGTIWGVETNSMQFYPDASKPEEAVHPGLYRRDRGCIDLRSIGGAGFGYRLDEIDRALPDPAYECGRSV